MDGVLVDQELSCSRFKLKRWLRWMCGHTRRDKIRNEKIRDKVGMASVVRWFGHVKRRCVDPSEEVREVAYSGYEER